MAKRCPVSTEGVGVSGYTGVVWAGEDPVVTGRVLLLSGFVDRGHFCRRPPVKGLGPRSPRYLWTRGPFHTHTPGGPD